MNCRRLLTAAVLFTFTAGFIVVGAPSTPGATAGQAKKVNAYKVQIRHPGWDVHPVPDQRAAKILGDNLRRGGWTTQIQGRGKNFVVRARMPNWFTRTVVSNKGVAEGLAQEGRSRGFQARIVGFHQ